MKLITNYEKNYVKLIKNSRFYDQMWKRLAIVTNKILTDTDLIFLLLELIVV